MSKHRHHLIPKHAGGENEEVNLTPPISIRLHAMFHYDRWRQLGDIRDFLAWRMLSGVIGREEARLVAVSAALKGKPKTAEHIAKLVIAHTGKKRGPHSANTILKLIAAAKIRGSDPVERQLRSARAKSQHATGSFGYNTVSEQGKQQIREAGRKALAEHGQKGRERAWSQMTSEEMSRRSRLRKIFKSGV